MKNSVGVLAVMLLLLVGITTQHNKNRPNDNRLYLNRGFLSSLFPFFGKPRTCNCLCGRPNRESVDRLLNGEYTQSNEFPWFVAVVANNSRIYGGVLINDRYVLTAASVLNSYSPFDIKVTLGANDRCVSDLSSVNESVSMINWNPNYNPQTGESDLALLKLGNPVTFSRKINPICLPEPNARYLGQVVTLVSWGAEQNETENSTSGEAARACIPKKVGLPVIGEGSCPNVRNVQSNTGCAGIAGAPDLACESDAGAPVQFRDHRGIYQLAGVVSENNNCSASMPTLYTRVNRYVQWIYQHTADACYCSNAFGIFH